MVSADLYAARVKNFTGTAKVETPNVFLDRGSVESFVLARLDPLIRRGEIGRTTALSLARLLSEGAIGTVAADGFTTPELVLGFRNFGEAEYWGADLAARYLISDRLRIDLNYSHINDDCFDLDSDGECPTVEDIALNAARHKGSLGLAFDNPANGFSARLRTRATGSFPMNSGVYVGEVSGYMVVDGSLRLDLSRWSGTSVSITGTNIFDHRHQEFVGAPEIGRLWLLQLRREF